MKLRQHNTSVPFPPAIRRQMAWLPAPIAAVFVGGALILLPSVRNWLIDNNLLVPVFLAFGMLPTVGVLAIIYLSHRKIKKKVIAASGNACVNCTQDLTGLGHNNVCPECGRQFDLTNTRLMWKRVGIYKGS